MVNQKLVFQNKIIEIKSALWVAAKRNAN